MTVEEIEEAGVQVAGRFFSKVRTRSCVKCPCERWLTMTPRVGLWRWFLHNARSPSLRGGFGFWQPHRDNLCTFARWVFIRFFMAVANRFAVEQEVARQKILPFSSYWARNSPYGTPVGALTFHWIFSVILILASKFSKPIRVTFEFLRWVSLTMTVIVAPNRNSGDGMYLKALW